MSVVVIQISDIHFTAPRDAVASRASSMVSAVLAEVPKPDSCILLFTGDVANTGAQEEYRVAHDFIFNILSELNAAGVTDCHVLAIPGNHDLNLRTEDATRKFLLDSLGKFLEQDVEYNASTFRAIISVQDNFFEFLSQITNEPLLQNSEKLYYRHMITVNGHTILFHCFNTAWLSRRHEQQAKLFLPPQIYDHSTSPGVALSVAVFHHPYNWLESNNQKQLEAFVNCQVDVVLTGHEHDSDIVRHESITGETLDYLMAPAFNDPSVQENGFQMLTIDFQNESQIATIFNWEKSRFTVAQNKLWKLQRNAQRPSDPMTLRSEFLAQLSDMGTAFRHPRCAEPNCKLRLRDLYVYPDLKHREVDKILKNKKSERPPILGHSFAEFLASHPYVLLFGADDCGKTSFAKIIFEDLKSRGDFPLLISGESLKKVTKDKALVAQLSKSILQQYATKSTEPYLQASPDRRVLIIDDFDKAKLSKEAQRELIACLKDRFRRLLVIVPDYMEIQDMLANAETDAFFGFERCTIKEFGHFHRQKLIETWIRLGRDTTEESSESIHKLVMSFDKTISTLMGKNTLPHHPLTILSLLQLLESRETVGAANGAYGYLYEMLLKQALARVNARDVNEKITYLSGIGYAMFTKKDPAFTEEEMRREHDSYCDRYDMVRDFSKMMGDLARAEVLVEADGIYRFKYPYEFYYSTAKYFQDHASDLRNELLTISDHIYGERNANVIIFYVYLTRDDSLIRHIVNNAKQIFAEFKECDMEADVEFMNKLSSAVPPPLELEYGDSSNRRDEYNLRRDKQREESETFEVDDNEVTYDEKLQALTKILIAIKTLQVLGQILRNFTANLEGPLKLEIIRECYSLTLRTIMALLSYCEKDVPGLRQYIGHLIAERTGITDPKKLASRTDDVIVWMGTAAAHGMVKRVSFAVGHSDLVKTYRRVLERDKRLSVNVIDTAIRLDHFNNPPQEQLSELSRKVRKNNFAFTVIRELVGDYLYFYDQDFKIMQRLGAEWNIAVNAPKLISNRSKR
jgi:predicted MPP superfamily phosphohydrolase